MKQLSQLFTCLCFLSTPTFAQTGAPATPITGGTTNATVTGTSHFQGDVKFKGSNPWFDLRDFGGYSNGAPPTTTGSITVGQTRLSLARAQDFVNGQGIVIYRAGPATRLTTPAQPTVSPMWLGGGATTYAYQVVAEDRNGGLTAASTAGTTTTGAATIGINRISITNCVRTSAGIATYTTSATHNLTAGTQVYIQGYAYPSVCAGVKTITSTPTGTTFTTNDGAAGAETNATAASAQFYACNQLTFPPSSYSGTNTIHYWIYRNNVLIGVAQGVDPYYQDCGLNAPTAPAYVPSTPPASAQPGYLATTITAGGGTTTLTLANAAYTTATSQTVQHDNSRPLLACLQQVYNHGGGECYIPDSAAYWDFNATTDFSTLSGTAYTVSRTRINSSLTRINQPWIIVNFQEFIGAPRKASSFQYAGDSYITGNAYPLLLLPCGANPGSSTTRMERLGLNALQAQQSAFLSDGCASGGGNVGIVADKVSFAGSGNQGVPLLFKGGFDFFLNDGNYGAGLNFSPNSAIRLAMASPALVGANVAQTGGRLFMRGINNFGGSAIQIDCSANPSSAVSGYAPSFAEGGTILYENVQQPFLRWVNCFGSSGGLQLDNLEEADNASGAGTPIIDAASFMNGLYDVNVRNLVAYTGNQPILILGGSGGSYDALGPMGIVNLNPKNSGNPGTGRAVTIANGEISLNNGAAMLLGGRSFTGYALAAPPALVSCKVSSGVGIAPGSYSAIMVGVDVNGNRTSIGGLCVYTTTRGNGVVTYVPPVASSFPVGTVGWFPYRGFANGSSAGLVRDAAGTCSNAPAGTPFSLTASFVDNFSAGCGNGAPQNSAALASGINLHGVLASQLRITGGVTNDAGLQFFNTTTTCTTAATADTSCTTAAITLPVAYSDTNYRLFCTGLNPTNFPIVQTVTKSNRTFTITVVTLTAAAATFASFDCYAGHN